MTDQPKLVHSNPDMVWARNDGPGAVFYGQARTEPDGKIESRCSKRIPKNSVYWSDTGSANVSFPEFCSYCASEYVPGEQEGADKDFCSHRCRTMHYD